MKIFKPRALGFGLRLSGLGIGLPERRVTNADLQAMGAPMSADEMGKLTGITERRWAAPEQAASDLALLACREALTRSKRAPAEIERLVLGTVSPDHPSPSTACAVQHALGLGQVPAFDVSAACSSFVFALELAARSVATGEQAVLAAAVDVRSRYLDVSDRATVALFGDGAVAAVVEKGPVGEGLIAIGVGSDGSGVKSVYVPAGGSREPVTAEAIAQKRHRLTMQDGPAVYLQAVDGMLDIAKQVLDSEGLGFDDVKLVVPHQANKRMLDRLARFAGLPPEKVVITVDTLGNTSGASCGLALERALSQGRVAPGEKVLLVAAGAGYTAGAALLSFDAPTIAATLRPPP